MKKLGSRLVSRTLHRDKETPSSNVDVRDRDNSSPDSSSFVNVEFETARPASRVLRAPVSGQTIQEDVQVAFVRVTPS